MSKVLPHASMRVWSPEKSQTDWYWPPGADPAGIEAGPKVCQPTHHCHHAASTYTAARAPVDGQAGFGTANFDLCPGEDLPAGASLNTAKPCHPCARLRRITVTQRRPSHLSSGWASGSCPKTNQLCSTGSCLQAGAYECATEESKAWCWKLQQ